MFKNQLENTYLIEILISIIIFFLVGYFFMINVIYFLSPNKKWESFPEELELAARYAWLTEPNETNLALDNERKEFTVGANWFFNGHINKVTLDYSKLSIEDGTLAQSQSDNRVRLQWDVSF